MSPAGRGPRRSARRRTCWADSSADTSSTGAPVAGHRRQDLEQQRRLAHPGLAPEQRHRSRDEPAPEDPVELGQARRDRARLGRVDVADGTAARSGAVGGARTRRGRGQRLGRRGRAGAGAAAPRARRRAPRRGCSIRRRPGQRPAQRGVAPPHAVHRCTVRSRPTAARLRTGCDGQGASGTGSETRSGCGGWIRSRRPRRPARPAAARGPRRCGRRTRRPPRRR